MALNIKAVSERTGVPLHTLRAWERRYGIPRPQRNAENRYRLYSEQDIADVLWMKRQVETGVSPAQASALLLQQSRSALSPAPIAAPTESLRAALYDAFERHDDAAAQNVWNEAWSALAPELVLVDIVQPTLRRIGDRWQRNLLSVEQEHFASNLVRQRLAALILAQPLPSLSAPRLVAACAPEEQHDLGLLMITLLARRQGWQVNYLGQRTPLADLLHAGKDARFIVLSVSTVTGLASLAPLWNMEPLSTPILFGGDILNGVPVLREHLPGAFLGSDPVQSIQTMLTSTPRAHEWKPSRRMLNAAFALEDARFSVVGETAAQFPAYASRRNARMQSELRHDVTQPALFLTDALVSALAFDAPEILDMQAAWSDKFMPAHEISLAGLQRFVKLYETICAQALPADTMKLAGELLTRFRATLAFTPEGKELT